MPLQLSDADLLHLAECQRALLEPLLFERQEEWAASVCQALKGLLPSDQSMLRIQDASHPTGWQVFSTDIPPDTQRSLEAGTNNDETLDVAEQFGSTLSTQILVRQVPDGVARFRHSWILNEYLRPNGVSEALFLLAGRLRRVNCAPHFILFRNTPDTPDFGDRGVAICSLLVPAFEASMATAARLRAHRTSLGRTIDGVTSACALVTSAGVLVHRNPAMARMEAELPEPGALHHAIAALVLGAAGGRGALVRELRIGGKTLRLGVAALGRSVGNELFAVTVERIGAAPPEMGCLVQAFGFTRREAEVATLLGLGWSNQHVARELHTSPHTARRHTERVLLKLGVESRAAVAARLLNWNGSSR